MDPALLAMLIGGGTSALSGAFTTATTAIENRKQRKFAAAEAQKARDWAEEMSNTAHQREVADLREAGLNPILSATGGNGATTPTAASASSPATQNPALNGLQAAAAVYNAFTSGELNAASAKKAEADAALADAQSDKVREQTKVEKAKGDAVEKSMTWLERGWDFLFGMKSLDDVRHTFGLAANAGDVERHLRSLEDKKEHNRLLEQERMSNESVIDPPYGNSEGDDISNGVPDSWQFVKSDFNEVSKKYYGKNFSGFYFFDTYRKPNGDYVRVRRRGYNFKAKGKD